MLNILVNEESFSIDKYGEESIRKETQLVRYKFDVKTPAFKYIFLESSVLNDNSDYLKLGGEDETTFQSFDTSDVNM